jgi:ubiquitin C-terminal hydrolase
MGKSNKKKRRKERLRQQRREQQLSTFGALKVSSSKLDAPLTPVSNMIRTPDSPSHQGRRNVATTDLPTQHNKPSGSSATKVDPFGSEANRIRKLPVVSFVYPKNTDDMSAPVPYKFGTISVHSPIRVESSLNGVCSKQTNSIVKQSIDDILYPKHVVESTSHSSDITSATKSDPTVDHSLDAKLPAQTPLVSHEAKAGIVSHDEHTHRQPYLSGVSVEEAVKDKVGLRPRANSTDGELKLPQRGLCDERTVLESYKWRANVGHGIPKGFHNLGNTCFLNSTLQCLAYCPPFCQSLISILHAYENASVAPVLGNQPSSGKMSRGRILTLTLANLFRRVHHPTNRMQGAIAPRRIVDALPHLGSGSSRRNGYKFRPGRQEDAHEFLVHLLDSMNDGELREAGINADQSGWRDRLPVPRLDETTFVHRIFGGYLRSQVRCTDCGYRSNTYDPFLDLSLEISRNSCNSVMSAFHEFTRKETLDTNNRWKCSGCKKRVCATKQLTVFRPPLALCIQLKRFSYGGFGLGGKKISRPIEFPVKLQLPLSDGRSCAYVLTGIVIHVGGSASSGHYTAYVRKPCDSGDRTWFHMDDSFVQQVSEQHVLRQRDAYVVMYCRQEVKVEFPTPPLSGSMTAEEAKERMISRNRARSIGGSVNKLDVLVTETQDSSSMETATSLVESEQSDKHFVAENKQSLEAKTSLEIISSVAPPPSTDNASSDSDSSDSIDSEEDEEESSSGVSSPPETSPVAPTIFSKDCSASVSPSQLLSRDEVSDVSSLTGEKKFVESNVLHKRVDGYELGRIDVVLGPGKKRAWLPKTVEGQKRSNFDLLGNMHISKWEDDDDKPGRTDSTLPISAADSVRRTISKELENAEQDRKRKMFLDRHDALLDQGKVRFISPGYHSGSTKRLTLSPFWLCEFLYVS